MFFHYLIKKVFTNITKLNIMNEEIKALIESEVEKHISLFEIFMTMSIGLSQYKPGEDMKAFVHRVDTIMYQAKHQGRNRICKE